MQAKVRALVPAFVSLTIASAGLLPVSVLGPNKPQPVEFRGVHYPLTFTGGTGGGFYGRVATNDTTLWCVDSQHWTVPGPVNGSVILVNNIGAGPTPQDYDDEVRNAKVTNLTSTHWTYFTSEYNTAAMRYTMAAWLIEQYSGFPSGPNSDNARNQAVQRAIWQLMRTSEDTNQGLGDISGNIKAGAPGESENRTWVDAAAAAYAGNWRAKNWAVISWGVDESGNLLTGEGEAHQTFLAQVVPEPGFYGLLALGLGGLFVAARRRKPGA